MLGVSLDGVFAYGLPGLWQTAYRIASGPSGNVSSMKGSLFQYETVFRDSIEDLRG